MSPAISGNMLQHPAAYWSIRFARSSIFCLRHIDDATHADNKFNISIRIDIDLYIDINIDPRLRKRPTANSRSTFRSHSERGTYQTVNIPTAFARNPSNDRSIIFVSEWATSKHGASIIPQAAKAMKRSTLRFHYGSFIIVARCVHALGDPLHSNNRS